MMNSDKKSLKTLYLDKKNAAIDFREGIMNLLGISQETFSMRMRDNSWKEPEKKLLSIHLGEPIEVLFPETAGSHV